MPKSNIKQSLDELSKPDIYSIILFALWRIKENPDFALLSELSYILDNDSLVKFLKYYGGKQITIPTISEFRNMLDALLLYQEVNVENVPMKDALKELIDKDNISEVKNNYTKICDILDKYDFKRD